MNKRRIISAIVTMIILLLLGVGIYLGVSWFNRHFEITDIKIEGNKFYTDREIEDFIISSRLDRNAVYFKLKTVFEKDFDIPYTDAVEVNIVFPNKIEIIVYERSVIGCVFFMENYAYIDKDGYVVFCKTGKEPDIPLLSGLDVSNVVVGKKLNDDTAVFEGINLIRRLSDKYLVPYSKIYCSLNGYEVYSGEIVIKLGADVNEFEGKFSMLPDILRQLTDKEGTLDMHVGGYDEKRYTFTEKK